MLRVTSDEEHVMLAERFLSQMRNTVLGTLRTIFFIVNARRTTWCSKKLEIGLLSAMIGELFLEEARFTDIHISQTGDQRLQSLGHGFGGVRVDEKKGGHFM